MAIIDDNVPDCKAEWRWLAADGQAEGLVTKDTKEISDEQV